MNFRKHLFSGIVLQGIGLSLFAQTDKPNIVVIMTDQQRADLCGREGFPMDITPFVDELAHQNAWFDKAVAHSEKGGLKKAFSIITSRRYDEDDYIILREKDFD